MTELLRTIAAQSSTEGNRGVVLAAAPQAAALGAEAMRQGGNAYDAVVVAALAETVLLPPKCGLAGDLVAIAVSGPGQTPDALLAIGGAPAGLAEAFESEGRVVTGPRSVGVPGAPAGYAALGAKGRLSWSRLVQPAIDLARQGFVWARVCAELAALSTELVLASNPEPPRYFPDGEVPEAGLVMELPGMARLLEEFADSGQALFQGTPGEKVAEYVQSLGGVLTGDDFGYATATWATPAGGRAGGHWLWATPAPTHGPALLAAMSGEMAAPENQGQIWARVMRGRDVTAQLAGASGTSMVGAADTEGNAVTVVHSNSFPRFGSGLVVPEYDLILSNRPGRGFGDDPRHHNFPAPGRRPATTLHAWALDLEGEGVLLGGTPGGDNQMPWNVQLLGQYLAGTRDPGLLVVSPRWALVPPDSVRIEAGFGHDDVEALRKVARSATEIPRWGLRSAQQVLMVRPDLTARGAVDPRTGGLALAV